MHLGAEDVGSCMVVLGVLEAELSRLGPDSRMRGMWDDWRDLLRGEPLPFQVPWDSPATSAQFSASGE